MDAALDRRISKLATKQGFNEAYEKETLRTRPNEKAYEVTEELRVKYFNERAYSSFDSFRICRNRMIKKRAKE